MSEKSLRDVIQEAVDEFVVSQNGGFITGFVCLVEGINSEGEKGITIAHAENQMTHTSMGMAAYLTEWFKDDAILEFETCWAQAPEDED